MQLLKEAYKDRTKHLLESSRKSLEKFESNDTTMEAKKGLVEAAIDFYRSPTSHDKLFSKDIVIFNGKGKPTILTREDFNEIRDNWTRLLSIANAKTCVDDTRNGDHITMRKWR
jgi:hypothetical protein